MKKRVIFVDDVPNQYSKCKEYIKEIVEGFFDDLGLECELKVKFIAVANNNEFEKTDCMIRNISMAKRELVMTDVLLDTIRRDGGRFFSMAIYHEMEHLRDYSNMIKTNLFKFSLSLRHQKNFERSYVSVGFHFWTEFYAYYQAMQFAKENEIKIEAIPFGQLLENYLKTVKRSKELYNKKDLSSEEGDQYIDMVCSFVYLCAKYMASVYARHSRVPHAKIVKNKDYQKVYAILCGFEPKVRRLFMNPYSPKSYDNLFKLGKYICENVRWKIFKVGLIKHHGKVYMCL